MNGDDRVDGEELKATRHSGASLAASAMNPESALPVILVITREADSGFCTPLRAVQPKNDDKFAGGGCVSAERCATP
ncbi:MAG: hypothetical protein J0H27_05125 [Xanthomonadales bacterium]|nr:hypothetical protein [Xanthomonadales bacterium]